MPSPLPPVTFRPRGARRVIYPTAVAVVSSCALGAMLLPEKFRIPDRVGVLAVGLLLGALLLRLAAVRIETDDTGLTVVNFLRRHRLAWAQVVDVRLGSGDPWVTLDLSDGETLAALGIQGSDGEHARAQASELGSLVARHSRPSRND